MKTFQKHVFFSPHYRFQTNYDPYDPGTATEIYKELGPVLSGIVRDDEVTDWTEENEADEMDNSTRGFECDQSAQFKLLWGKGAVPDGGGGERPLPI
jgi:hypothetical protein